MKKQLLLLLFMFNSLLLSENNYQKIVDESLEKIERDYLTLIEDNQFERASFFSSYSDALLKAKKEDKMILLEIVLDDCKFCEKMERFVLSKKSVQEEISKHFILAQINADRETLPLGLSEQMSPTFVFVSKDEVVKDMRFGYMDEENFLKLLVEESTKS